MLSKEGKEVLLKSMAQAVPSYYMSVFQIPLSLCDEFQKIMNDFGGEGGIKGWIQKGSIS